jgi:hypothetical protein
MSKYIVTMSKYIVTMSKYIVTMSKYIVTMSKYIVTMSKDMSGLIGRNVTEVLSHWKVSLNSCSLWRLCC